MKPPSDNRIMVAYVILAALLFGSCSLAYSWTAWDDGSAGYIASTILTGGIPYRDAWDVRGPGIGFAYALSFLLFGQNAAGLRVFDLLWQTATALLLAFAASRLYRRPAAGAIAAAAYLLVYFSQDYWNWAEPDGMLSLPLSFSILFMLRGEQSNRLSDWAAAGLGVGAAVMFKLPLGLTGLGLLAAAVTREGIACERWVKRPLALALGLSVPVVGMLMYLNWNGALADFLTTQFVVAPAYVARVRAKITPGDILGSLSQPVMITLYMFAGLGLYGVVERAIRAERIARAERVLWVWVGTAVITIVLQGSYLHYLYLPLAAPLAMLGGGVLLNLYQRFEKTKAKRAGIGLILTVGLALVVPAVKLGQHYRYCWRVATGKNRKAGPLEELGTYLRQRTLAEDRIFIWGQVPVVYLYAGRTSCSRFFHTAFLSDSWGGVDYRPVFIKEFSSHKPRYFVEIKSKSELPEEGNRRSFRSFVSLSRIVDEEYQIEKTEPNYDVYRRKLEAVPK